MFLSRLTPPVPGADHAEKVRVLLQKHFRCLDDLRTELDIYFAKSISAVSSESPADVQSHYANLSRIGRSISEFVFQMPRSLEPLVDYAARIATTRTRVTELLEIYQSKMARVRKEETEQTVIEEGEALANFVASLKELNLSSNNYLVAFQTTYTPSWKHFSHGLAQIALRFGEIADTPATAVLTDEERALDNELLELQREIEQSEAQATPP